MIPISTFKILTYLAVFSFIPFPLFSSETTGWYSKSGQHRLFVDGIKVFDSQSGDIIQLPEKLDTSQEIEAYMYLAEYFLKKKNRQGIATILYKIRLKPKDYRLADALITTLWKKSNSEDQVAQKTLDSYIQSEKNPYYKSLARNIYATLFVGGEDEKKSPERMNCDSKLPYYSFCRLFRLQYYLDRTSGKGDTLKRHYTNIMRVLSPFYEEISLHAIPFLEDLDEELPPRLAFLGLANESLNFQRMILEAERAALGQYSENSLERVSFLQIVSGKWEEAESSLRQLAYLSRNRSQSYRNRILIKLGMISYLSGKYDDSLKYYLGIDFSDWSSLITHPIVNEPLSIPEAKDLIALSVWKTKGRESAVTALREMPQGDRVYQEEVWPRLRIAQLIMDSNPELASRIIDEISYLAQSRGWKRLEYTSTLLQGYNRILEEDYRKSTVEFTKSRGILGSDESQYSNDWLRLSGMVFAHTASGKKAPVSNFIRASLDELQKSPPHEELLTIQYYRPQAFDWKKFVKTSLDYLSEISYSMTMLETLYQYNSRLAGTDEVYETGMFQIQSVHDRFQNLGGFQTHRESNFQESTYSTSRASIVEYLNSEWKGWDGQFEKNIQNPMIAIFPWEDNYYLFTFDPNKTGNSRWNHELIVGSNPLSTQGKDRINQFIDGLKNPKSIQIYLNSEGMEVYEFFRKIYKSQAFHLFSRFKSNSNFGKDRNLAIVAWKKNPPLAEIMGANRRMFEGSIRFPEKNRLHIWDYKNIQNKSLIQSEWKNGEDPTPISMKRMIRRMDDQTVPTAILVTSQNLGISFGSDPKKVFEWAEFWLKAGTEAVYYKKDLNWKKETMLYKDMPVGVSWNQDSDVICITRDLY